MFQNGGFFPIVYFFLAKRFFPISTDLVTEFQKFLFHMKALQTKMQLKWFRRYLYTRKTQVSKTAICFLFVTHCMYFYIGSYYFLNLFAYIVSFILQICICFYSIDCSLTPVHNITLLQLLYKYQVCIREIILF